MKPTQGEMITAFIDGGLNVKNSFFSNLTDVLKKDKEGTKWNWLSKKEPRVKLSDEGWGLRGP